MNNVPAGTVAVRAAFIGYKSTQVEGVKVLAGQTITVDIQLEQTAVQIQEITVVTQTQPLVPRDEVTSQAADRRRVRRSNLPVDRINEVLALQPGVVASRTSNPLDPRRPHRPEAPPTSTASRSRPATAAPARATLRSRAPRRHRGQRRHQRLRRGLGHHRLHLGRVRQRAVRRHLDRRPRPAAPSTPATSRYENDALTGTTASGFNRLRAASAARRASTGCRSSCPARSRASSRSRTGKDADQLESSCRPASTPWWRCPPSAGEPDGRHHAGADPSVRRSSRATAAASAAAPTRASPATTASTATAPACPAPASRPTRRSAKLNYTLRHRLPDQLQRPPQPVPGPAHGLRHLLGHGRVSAASPTRRTSSASRNWNNVYTLNWTQNLSKSTERALALETFLSYQQDRTWSRR